MAESQTKIGVGVIVFKNGSVLLGRGKGSRGAGEYTFPGGHLEYMEGFEKCAQREVLEKCGIEISNVEFLFLTNASKYTLKHSAHITLVARWKNGTPIVKEEEWGWHPLEVLPEPLFERCKLSMNSYKNGADFYEKTAQG